MKRQMLVSSFLLLAASLDPTACVAAAAAAVEAEIGEDGTITTSETTPTKTEATTPRALAQAQVDWIRSKGGFFHASLEMQPLDKSDPKSSMGVYAVHDLPKDKTLMIIPRSCLLTAGIPGSTEICDTARNLMKQRLLGDASEFAPYVNYLFHDNHKGQLPSAWSEAGQELLTAIGGDDFPPYDVTGVWFEDHCGDDADDPEFAEEAYHLVVRRSWDDKMLPVFDMCNHRNGRWNNVDSNSAHKEDEDIRVFAIRDIQAGEQLYLSYNECADCDFAHTYVLQDIIREFGFVEQYPRRWRFPIPNTESLVFEIDEKPGSSDGDLTLEWLSDPPTKSQIKTLQEELDRVRQLGTYVSLQMQFVESSHERDVSREFYLALITALEFAIRAAGEEVGEHPGGECVISVSDGDDDDEGAFITDTCTNSTTAAREYDALDEVSEETEYNSRPCVWDFVQTPDLFETHDETESLYNEIRYEYNKEMKNMCLHLNDHLQACSSFRPHYHEVFVHYPARYVDEVKRVAYLGGGDNMVIHEILKYPSLELVVGLELDQQVVRTSFRNFGTQPHFDDERVQWYFGDASKSLLMLPEELYGSFDLVLLDLQTEVVEVLKVLDDLTIMDAAMLLLRPGGIVARNEDWDFATAEPFTDYTVDLYYVDVPMLCCQGVTLGSNSVDFIKRKPKDHKVDTLFLKPPNDGENWFDLWHNYRKSSTQADKLTAFPGTKGMETPGLLMILEAEGSSLPLKSSSAVQSSISAALKKAGLTEISFAQSDAAKEGDEYTIAFILQEGYVVARTWPEHAYCAFDILLWSSFEKQNVAKTELIAVFGSKTPSSYRFVTNGMSGVKKENVGPRANINANESTKQRQEQEKDDSAEQQQQQQPVTEEDVNVVLNESISWLQQNTADSALVVVVLCGGEQSQPCRSLDAIKKLFIADIKLLPLWTCSSLVAGASAADDNAAAPMKDMIECEQETLRSIVRFVKANNNAKINGLVIDPDASFRMGQVLHKILAEPHIRQTLLAMEHVVLSTTSDPAQSVWRRALLDQFRTEFAFFAPAHRAVALFKNKEGLELGVFARGDDFFLSHFMSVVQNIEAKSGMVSEIPSVMNALEEHIEEFVPSKTFTDRDYDNSAALEQLLSQRPLGEQTIFQFDAKFEVTTAKVEEALQTTLGALTGEYDKEGQINLKETVGNGCVMAAFWENQSVVLSWDGGSGLTVNFFAPEQGQAKLFQVHFSRRIQAPLVMHEVLPRGFGRVVDFDSVVTETKRPQWAKV